MTDMAEHVQPKSKWMRKGVKRLIRRKRKAWKIHRDSRTVVSWNNYKKSSKGSQRKSTTSKKAFRDTYNRVCM